MAGTRKVMGPADYGMKRTMKQKIAGAKARVGGLARGEEEIKSKAPRVLPTGAAKGPNLKPRGTSTGDKGVQSVARGRALIEKAKKQK